MHDIKNIAIIGAGQLGSRHLQALAKIAIPVEIVVVDPSPESLRIAEKRFKEIPFNPNVKNIYYFSSINDLHPEIDFCIVATNSDVRAIVVEELLLKKRVEYLILEKVLFQSEGEFANIERLIDKNKVRTWVNCPRRMWPVYKGIHDNLTDSHLLEINISGSNWGLASNSIHMIDLIAYLVGITEYNISGDILDPDVVASKRKGFIEFSGSLKGSFKDGPNFSISSYKDGKVPPVIQLISEQSIYFISEHNGRGWLSREAQSWAWQEFSFETPYQSQLTHRLIKQIIDTGASDLTSFEESARLHIPLLNCFISFLSREGKEVDRCPIT
jgi:predicted dehydrogenase